MTLHAFFMEGPLWFHHAFGALTGWSPLAALCALAFALFVYRAWLAVTGDQTELARQTRVVADVRRGLADAQGSLHLIEQRLEADRLEAHLRAWLRRTSVTVLAHFQDIGPRTVTNLREAGCTTLAQVLEGGAWRARMVAGFRVAALTEAATRLATETARELIAPRSSKRDATIDRLYDEARLQVRARHEQLTRDAGDLSELDTAITAFAEQLRATDTSERLTAWVLSWTDMFSRFGAQAGLMFLLTGIIAATSPALVLGAAGAPAWACGAAATAGAWSAVIAFLLSWFALSDLYAIPWQRAPDPTRFDEQRMAFVVARLAARAGVALPRVVIVQDPSVNAYAIGRRRGPSMIALHTGLLATLAPDEVEVVAAHEVGHLAGDHLRLRSTIMLLATPIDRLGLAVALRASSWAWSITHASEHDHRVGLHSVAPLIGLLLIAPPLVVLVGARLSLRTLASTLSVQSEFDADRASAQLTSRSVALRAFDRVRSLAPGAELHTHGERAALDLLHDTASDLPERKRFALRLERFLADLHDTHPTWDVRIAALEQPDLVVLSGVDGLGRAAVSFALGAMCMWTGSAVAWNGAARAITPLIEAASVSMQTEVAAPVATVTVDAPKSGACNLRRQPSTTGEVLGEAKDHAICEIAGPPASGWSHVRCDGVEGWIHGSCLAARQ